MKLLVNASVAWPTLLVLAAAAVPGHGASQQPGASPDGVALGAPAEPPLLAERVESFRARGEATAGGDQLLAASALPRFYEDRAFASAWTGRNGARRLTTLVASIRGSERHGLDPEAYHLRALDSLLTLVQGGSALGPTTLADLELLASDAFLVLGSHLLHGRVDPESLNPEWTANRRNARLDTILAVALAEGRIGEALEGLAPAQGRYRSMLEARERLASIRAAGGWASIGAGPALSVGMLDDRVARVRARLVAGGDLPAASGGLRDAAAFDEELEEAVRRFQRRHGLDDDGVVGRATLEALDVPVDVRLSQLDTNLERWRWLPDDLGRRHIEVNIAGFETRLVDGGAIVSRHRSVVGRTYRQTPMFSGSMTYLVLSPYWHVPPNIAQIDKLPAIRRDPGEIARQRMTLLDLETNRPADPYSIDWSAITGGEFNARYRLRQDPGTHNALGDVKFMFPNRHNVYLHDTPSRELFSRSTRDFSSGCIRVEGALDLAALLLRAQPDWTRERIDRVVAEGVERTVRLTEPVPVHLLYWTAWIEEDGVLHFRNDLYGRDDVVRRALLAPPPVQ